jgi:hypothetical protein
MCRVYGGLLIIFSVFRFSSLWSGGGDTQGLGVSRQLYVGIGHTLRHCGLGDWAVRPGG